MLCVEGFLCVWHVGGLHVDVHKGLQSRAGRHPSPAFLAGAVLWIPRVPESREAAGGGCVPVVGPGSTAVCVSLQRTGEAAERV